MTHQSSYPHTLDWTGMGVTLPSQMIPKSRIHQEETAMSIFHLSSLPLHDTLLECTASFMTHLKNRKEVKYGCLKVLSLQPRRVINEAQHKTVNLFQAISFLIQHELCRWQGRVSISKSWTLYWKLCQLVHPSSSHPTQANLPADW